MQGNALFRHVDAAAAARVDHLRHTRVIVEAIHHLDRSLQQVRPQKDPAMINGAHAIPYSDDADATRAALARVLGTRSVDAGGGWLIFALPPQRSPSTRLSGVARPSATSYRRRRGYRDRPPGRSATRAGACSRPSPSPVGSSSASTSPATRPRPSRASSAQPVRHAALTGAHASALATSVAPRAQRARLREGPRLADGIAA